MPDVDLFSVCEVGPKVIESPLERFQFHFQYMQPVYTHISKPPPVSRELCETEPFQVEDFSS